MTGHVGVSNSSTRNRDSSFLCLLAIYAAHVAIFHVFDVTSLISPNQVTTRSQLEQMMKLERDNASAIEKDYRSNVTDFRRERDDDVVKLVHLGELYSEQLSHKQLTRSSQFHRQTFSDHHMANSLIVNFDFLYLLTWIHRIKKAAYIFASVALSSSSWGIISGCVIFLLTTTDRVNAL